MDDPPLKPSITTAMPGKTAPMPKESAGARRLKAAAENEAQESNESKRKENLIRLISCFHCFYTFLCGNFFI